jgi:hypothetical protein
MLKKTDTRATMLASVFAALIGIGTLSSTAFAIVGDAVHYFRDLSVTLTGSNSTILTSNLVASAQYVVANATIQNTSTGTRSAECTLFSTSSAAQDTAQLTLAPSSKGMLAVQILKPATGSSENVKLVCKGDGNPGVSLVRAKMTTMQAASATFVGQ